MGLHWRHWPPSLMTCMRERLSLADSCAQCVHECIFNRLSSNMAVGDAVYNPSIVIVETALFGKLASPSCFLNLLQHSRYGCRLYRSFRCGVLLIFCYGVLFIGFLNHKSVSNVFFPRVMFVVLKHMICWRNPHGLSLVPCLMFRNREVQNVLK